MRSAVLRYMKSVLEENIMNLDGRSFPGFHALSLVVASIPGARVLTRLLLMGRLALVKRLRRKLVALSLIMELPLRLIKVVAPQLIMAVLLLPMVAIRLMVMAGQPRQLHRILCRASQIRLMKERSFIT
jgi:hypothetical protein